MQEVLWKERRSQSLIYWLQLNEEGAAPDLHLLGLARLYANDREFRDLQRAVIESGGRIQGIDSVNGVEGGLQGDPRRAPRPVRPRLLPLNARHDGKWHEVQIESATVPGPHVRARGGYVDF